MQDKLEVCIKDWAELADEYKELESRHKEYREVRAFILSSEAKLSFTDLEQVPGSSEEMCVRSYPSKVQTWGH